MSRIHPLTGELVNRAASMPRREELLWSQPSYPLPRTLNARYDAAQDSTEFENWWAASDTLDADSANNPSIRQKLVARSRYEVANNGYLAGMVQTHANYLVGIGPSLRMQTGNEGFNQVAELVWFQWTKAIAFRRKLWTMAHAKVQDGEGFGIVGINPSVNHRIQLDIRLIETEQCASEFNTNLLLEPNTTDGIIYDSFGNAVAYEILPYHPGSTQPFMVFSEAVRVPAANVLHWYTQIRPGQHRGIPEFTSTLQVGAASRRMREATVRAAEVAATLGAALISSGLSPAEAEQVTPFLSIPLVKGMMTTLPSGWSASQMKPENPSQMYEAFLKQQINETGRPKSMPRNIGMADSSDYNYASGRLDHQTYFSAIDVEREEANEIVLDKLFAVWWGLAMQVYGWRDFGKVPAHTWDWPKHPVADIKSHSASRDIDLKNGSIGITQVYADDGRDAEDSFARDAAFYGIPVEELKKRHLDTVYPVKQEPQPAVAKPSTEPADEEDEE